MRPTSPLSIAAVLIVGAAACSHPTASEPLAGDDADTSHLPVASAIFPNLTDDEHRQMATMTCQALDEDWTFENVSAALLNANADVGQVFDYTEALVRHVCPRHRAALDAWNAELEELAGPPGAELEAQIDAVTDEATGAWGAKPEVYVPSGDPPATISTVDLIVGDGQVATSGDRVIVHYVGKAWSTGEQFDASWDRDQPFLFELGAGDVITGWDVSIDGMAVGTRRKLIIPPVFAYGRPGVEGAIAPDETLVFIIDLLAIE
jgi:peptidylprolyl isomerase